MILSDVATYVTEKISSIDIDKKYYVTTDSLLQNKEGRELAKNLPPTVCSLTKFIKGDILISNIRPYLRKIWQADSTGACSLDVLVFRVKENHDANFLYSILLQDRFFDYVMKAPKGSKMPRGDQNHIMRFPIISFSEPDEKNIGSLIITIDNKIQINKQINIKLEVLANKLYNYWFVQFNFPDKNGKPYKASGGKMVYNDLLKREIPKGWDVSPIGTLFDSSRGISYSSKTINNNGVPMVNLASFNIDGSYKPEGIKYYSGSYTNEKILKPFDLVMCNTQQTAIDFSKDIIGRVFLVPNIFKGDIVYSHHVTNIKVKHDPIKFFLYRLFNTEHFHKYIAGFTNGTNILGLIFDGVENYQTELPENLILDKYAMFALNIEKIKSIIIKENSELIALRDSILPLLMNGQIAVSDIEKSNDNVIPFNQNDNYNQKYNIWIQNQGIAARGEKNIQTLKQIFDLMDDDDK